MEGGHSPPWKSSFSHFSPSILIFVVQTIYIRIRYVLASVFTRGEEREKKRERERGGVGEAGLGEVKAPHCGGGSKRR